MEGDVFFCEEVRVKVYINFEDDKFFSDCLDVVCEVNFLNWIMFMFFKNEE